MVCRFAACAVVVVLGVPAAAVAQSGGTISLSPPGASDPGPKRVDAHPGISDVIRSLRYDFPAAVSAPNLAVFGLGSAAAFGAHGIDQRAASSQWGSDGFFGPGNLAGSAAAQGAGALATYLVGRAFDAPRVSRLGAELIRAQIVSQSITQSVKLLTMRTRPDGTSLSLPSGHTASAFATATVLQSNFGWKVGAPAYAAAVWIGASRVQMKRHFVSDVVAGAAVGLVAGRSVTVGRGDFRLAVAPMVAPGGAGVSFVRVGSR